MKKLLVVVLLLAPGSASTHGSSIAPAPALAKALHTPLFRDLCTALDGNPIPWNTAVLGGNQGTPNYRMMTISARYLHSVRFGTPEQKQIARFRTLQILELQETHGHMTVGPTGWNSEQFVLDPHANFWIASMVAFTWGAWESQDQEVIDACSRWWAVHLHYLKLGWGKAGVRLPGTRLHSAVPHWDVDTKVFKLVHKIPFKIGPGESKSIVYLRKLLIVHPQCIPTKFAPGKLRMPLHFTSGPQGALSWMDRPPELPNRAVDWVHSTGPGKFDYEFGFQWETPLPW